MSWAWKTILSSENGDSQGLMMLVWDSLGDSESTVNQTESISSWFHHHFVDGKTTISWWWNHRVSDGFSAGRGEAGNPPGAVGELHHGGLTLEDYPFSTHTVALIHVFFGWFHRDTLKKIAIFWMATRWSRGFCSNISRQSHFWTCFEKPHGYISECILCWLIAPRKCCLVSFKIIQGNKACQSWRVLSSLVVLSLAVLQWPVCIDTILPVDRLPLTGNVPQGYNRNIYKNMFLSVIGTVSTNWCMYLYLTYSLL